MDDDSAGSVAGVYRHIGRGVLHHLQQSPHKGPWQTTDHCTARRFCLQPDTERMSSTSCNNFHKTDSNIFSRIEAFERAVLLLFQLLPGTFLDETVYCGCFLNSYFNNITDGVSACTFAREEVGCQWCFLFLPGTRGGDGTCVFWRGFKRGIGSWLVFHYHWKSHGTNTYNQEASTPAKNVPCKDCEGIHAVDAGLIWIQACP